MNASDRADMAIRMFEINRSMRTLREQIDAAAGLAKAAGATGLSLAAHHLSDSIATYTTELTKYMTGVLDELPRP
jgi:hypothetical protein